MVEANGFPQKINRELNAWFSQKSHFVLYCCCLPDIMILPSFFKDQKASFSKWCVVRWICPELYHSELPVHIHELYILRRITFMVLWFQQSADKQTVYFLPRSHFSISRTLVSCSNTLCRQTTSPCIWHSFSPFSVCKIWIQFSNERSLCWTFIFPVELLYQCLVNRPFSTLGVIYLDFYSLQNVGGKCLSAGGAPHASDLKVDWLLLPKKQRVSKYKYREEVKWSLSI